MHRARSNLCVLLGVAKDRQTNERTKKLYVGPASILHLSIAVATTVTGILCTLGFGAGRGPTLVAIFLQRCLPGLCPPLSVLL